MSCIKTNQTEENQNATYETMSNEENLGSLSVTIHLLELPDSLLLNIFSFLTFDSVGAVSRVCKRLHRISYDEVLWRNMFLQHYMPTSETPIAPKASSWRSEFKRLHYHTPALLSEEHEAHEDKVLHISFSHDGTKFATCSKDCYVKVWKFTSPVSLLFEKNLKSISTVGYTQFSQFNETDTSLLVSAVFSDTLYGEIFIFDLQALQQINDKEKLFLLNTLYKFRLQCSTLVVPRGLMGVWYDNDHYLSASLDKARNGGTQTVIKLCKVPKEVVLGEPVCVDMYRFYNDTGDNNVMLLQVAEVGRKKAATEDLELSDTVDSSTNNSSYKLEGREKIDKTSLVKRNRDKCQGQDMSSDKKLFDEDLMLCTSSVEGLELESEDSNDKDKEELEMKNGQGMLDGLLLIRLGVRDLREKLLIFTCGCDVNAPHRIGFKRVRWNSCIKGLNRNFRDRPDFTIEMHGDIVGLSLSPDHKNLYVNCRPWPKNYDISDSQAAPPTRKEIEISVIDLETFNCVGPVICSNIQSKNFGYVYVYLDVGSDCLTSGTEDNQGFLWDRHYNILLNSFPHHSCVSCVAIHPKDPEMAVSVSDDKTFKVWISRCKAREKSSSDVQF